LELLTPTALGSGDSDGLLDMLLLRDTVSQQPLLPGTSIAGALRSYLLSRKNGYRFGIEQNGSDPCELLFGGNKGKSDGAQSLLIIDDALAEHQTTVIRDGVRIEPQTRTAQDKKKFDYELLPPGTTFPLRLELRIPASSETDEQSLLSDLVLTLHGFEQQEISLGMRKRRGFGRCVVRQWQVQRYDMQQPADMLAWLATGLNTSMEGVQPVETRVDAHIANALGLAETPPTDNRQRATLRATFALASPLLIRSTEMPENHPQQPDVAHLHSNGAPVVSGTALAGALRARAQRILSTLAGSNTASKVQELLDSMFGHDLDKRPKEPAASRLLVDEVSITEPADYLVQQRVSIDRFTSGSYTTALFSEAPLAGGTVTIEIQLQGEANSSDYPAEVGLLLLLLKDLWTSDLPLGGTSSIGRGRLRGIKATLKSSLPECTGTWGFEQTPSGLQVTDTPETSRKNLEKYVKAVQQKVNEKEQGHESSA
jgi:CRISPR/Cas system CMR subunit Cmr4 (Cas7 group RAMP superfamily)